MFFPIFGLITLIPLESGAILGSAPIHRATGNKKTIKTINCSINTLFIGALPNFEVTVSV